MNISIIPPDKSIFEEIIPLLENDSLDYSSNLVVFPGKRPSHFLRKEISKHTNKSFIPPLILSMDEFIDYIFEKANPERKIDILDAVSILYEIHKSSPLSIGKGHFESPDTFFPLGIKIFNDLEELHIEQINFQLLKEVESFINDEALLTKENLQSLSFFYAEFYKKLTTLGFSTRSSRYIKVSEDINSSYLKNFKKVIFAGFYALTNSEKTIFKKLAALENTFFLFHEAPGVKEKIKELDPNITLNPINHEYIEPKIYFYSSPDTHGEVYALKSVLKDKKIDDIVNTKTVIVLPSSDTLFPLLRQCLNTFNEDEYNISIGYPLYRTPLYSFLNNLMETITSMDDNLIYIPHYMRFMLHPYTKNIYFNNSPETTRIIIHTLEENFSKKRTRTFLTLSEIEEEISKILDITSQFSLKPDKDTLKEHFKNIHQNTIKRFLSFKNIKDFATKCKELIEYIYSNSTAKFHPLFQPFAEAFINHMDLLEKSLLSNISFEKTPTYFTFFRKYIMNCRAPFEGTPLRGLQVLGFLETRNIKFDRVFFLDVNEEIIPDTKKEDSLLPSKVKQQLGLPTYMDRDNIIAYYFDILIKGAKEVHLFFVENDRKEKSRFVEKLIWEIQKRDNKLETERYIKPVQYKISLSTRIPEPIEKTEEIIKYLKNFIYSPTVLDDYLKCQIKFYYNYVLKLEKREEITGEIEKVDIGKIVHSALSSYFSSRLHRVLEDKDINTDEMEKILNNLFKQEYGENISGAVYLLKNQIIKRMKEILLKYYKPYIKEEKMKILSIEKELKMKFDGFYLKGRIDCIEQRNSEIRIIDYKISSSGNKLKINSDKLDINKRETWEDAIGSIQMPIYMTLFLNSNPKIKNIKGIYLLLGKSKIDKDIEFSPFDISKTSEFLNKIQEIVSRLLKEIVSQKIPFSPTNDLKSTCPMCNYKYICGTQWTYK